MDARALDVFEEALERPEGERLEWLRRAHSEDPELVAEVERLLRRDTGAAAVMPTAFAHAEPLEEAPETPERVGAYRVGALIGEGGMGAVHRAERDDGLFDHVAAVKLLRSARLGGREAELFAAERRTLARLNHPHIARLLDGGVTPEGAPYILMDYVEGEDIAAYVTARDPGPRELVGLLQQVCEAVAYAHRALVAHGDLKPANVLVTSDGQARLLDFGVARMLDLAGEAAGAAPLTGAYASPERRAGEPPTAADDIHGLGLTARELLTRRGPTLGEDRPSRPLDGDLDAVLGKATAEDPARRYGSVEALADDLARWRDKRPVAARGRGGTYVASRFVARRPALVAASALAVAALAVTAVISTALYLRAEREHLQAERRFADARWMANYLLFDIYDRLDRAPRTLAVRRDLAATGQGYLDRLVADPRAPVGVKVEAVQGLVRLATVQGGGRGRNLGQVEQARANLERAASLADQLAADYPERADVALALAAAHIEQAVLVIEREGRAADAERALTVARRALDRALRAAAPDLPALRKAEVQWALRISSLRQWQGRYPEAVANARAALAAIARLPPPLVNSPEARLLEADAYDLMAEATYYAGGEAGAVAPYRRQLEILEALSRERPDDPVAGRALSRAGWALGTTLLSLNRAAEALPLLEAADRRAQALVAFDPEDEQARRTFAIVRQARAQALALLRRYDEALPLLVARADELREALRLHPSFQIERDYAIALASVADAHADARRAGPACRAYADAMQVWDDLRRKKQLTRLDQDYAIRLIRERTRTLCPTVSG
ncbi:MAG TPA: serine/threonine-protein kinase [Caulobacteraceae bacterium]|jgi:serine/threonine-protein kinase